MHVETTFFSSMCSTLLRENRQEMTSLGEVQSHKLVLGSYTNLQWNTLHITDVQILEIDEST